MCFTCEVLIHMYVIFLDMIAKHRVQLKITE